MLPNNNNIFWFAQVQAVGWYLLRAFRGSGDLRSESHRWERRQRLHYRGRSLGSLGLILLKSNSRRRMASASEREFFILLRHVSISVSWPSDVLGAGGGLVHAPGGGASGRGQAAHHWHGAGSHEQSSRERGQRSAPTHHHTAITGIATYRVRD